MRSRKNLGFAALAALLMTGLVVAATPQTIVVDGANDFLVVNLVDADGGDTEHTQLDLDSIFVTNDTNKLYFGIKYDRGDWTGNQIGIAIATGEPGGTTDAWGRAIAWTNAPHKPDYYAYTNIVGSWQELRHWNDGTSTWDVIYDGVGSLGWVNDTGFEEVGLNLSDLGLALGDTFYYEVISTQEGSTKGPLDLMAGDDDQLSTPTGTTWDVSQPVELDSMFMYIVQASLDTIPPVVEQASAPGVIGDTSSEIHTEIIEVRFSEPVDETTAETAGNYTLYGTTAGIDSVVRNELFPDRVSIYLDTSIAPSYTTYQVRVLGVEDLSSNTIVDDLIGLTNYGSFFYKGLMWKGLMGLHLRQHSFAPTVDTFTVEGSLTPLTFSMCDNMFLSDNSDSIYVGFASFSLLGEEVGSVWEIQDTTLEWKFAHQCVEYEPLATNRTHVLSWDNGAWDTLEYWWNDEDAESFTAQAIDVIFTVDANTYSPTVDSIMAINGSALPLTFDIPSANEMADDGSFPDDAASDGIYSIAVRFPALSPKTVEYKYVYNGLYECQLEGNRDVWLNDAAYDTIGGAMGPIVMPLQYYDRCSTIGRAVEVVFKVDTRWVKPGPGDTIAVNGDENNQLPLVMSWSIPSINPMADDGIYPDDTAGDGIYAKSIIFPDSSNRYVEYKYLFNSTYECTTQANRSFHISELFDAIGNPQILDLAFFNTCWIDVTEETPTLPFELKQNFPNPFNPVTTITFSVPERGRAVLSVYNVKGELVQTLVDDVVSAGEVSVTWDATDRYGRQISSGVYFYRLRVGDLEMSRKMILLR
jgi:hypothetical protein